MDESSLTPTLNNTGTAERIIINPLANKKQTHPTPIKNKRAKMIMETYAADGRMGKIYPPAAVAKQSTKLVDRKKADDFFDRLSKADTFATADRKTGKKFKSKDLSSVKSFTAMKTTPDFFERLAKKKHLPPQIGR